MERGIRYIRGNTDYGKNGVEIMYLKESPRVYLLIRL